MNTANKQYGRLTKKGGYTKELDLKQELGYSYIYNRLSELEDKIEAWTLVELGYHIRKSYRNHDDQRYKIILIDEVEIDKIGYDGLTKAEAEKKLKELQEEYQWQTKKNWIL